MGLGHKDLFIAYLSNGKFSYWQKKYEKLAADNIVDVRTEFSCWFQTDELGDNRVCLIKSGQDTC